MSDLNPIKDIKGYVEFMAGQQLEVFIANNGKDSVKEMVYTSMDALLMENAQLFIAKNPLPKEFEQMERGECYGNATKLACDHPELIYVEGMGASIIPMGHAWLVDSKGNVIDPTWDYKEGREYFGVPFETSFVLERVCKKETYGLIDDWQSRYPLLHEGIDPSVIRRIG